MGRIIRGEGLGEKENKKVRTWDREKDGKPLIAFTEEDENEGSNDGKKTPAKTQCEPKTVEVVEPVVEQPEEEEVKETGSSGVPLIPSLPEGGIG